MGENKKVDLQCEKCYRKVKKVLCKFPQIRDQKYDEKNNQVIIEVVCCSPEKIRDKLCCKGGCVIKSIDIIEPVTVKPTPPPKKPTTPPEKPPPTEKCKCPPVTCTCPPVKCTCPPVKCTCPPLPRPVTCPRPPVNTCCTECYGGHPGGPCQTGYGYIQYDGYCGRAVYESYGSWRSYNTSSYCAIRPNCFSEENPQACAIM